jgi:hypothetical protein
MEVLLEHKNGMKQELRLFSRKSTQVVFENYLIDNISVTNFDKVLHFRAQNIENGTHSTINIGSTTSLLGITIHNEELTFFNTSTQGKTPESATQEKGVIIRIEKANNEPLYDALKVGDYRIIDGVLVRVEKIQEKNEDSPVASCTFLIASLPK